MRQVNLAISSLTHAHVRKYYATLDSNAKLNWVAVSCANEAVAEDFKLYGYDIPIYRLLLFYQNLLVFLPMP